MVPMTQTAFSTSNTIPSTVVFEWHWALEMTTGTANPVRDITAAGATTFASNNSNYWIIGEHPHLRDRVYLLVETDFFGEMPGGAVE